MEGEVGAQVAPAIFLHQALPDRFHELPLLAKKRDLPWQHRSFHHQQQDQQWVPNPNGNWNPKLWDWDSVRFTAKASPDATENLNLGTQATAIVSTEVELNKKGENSKARPLSSGLEEDSENLTLNLGGGLYSAEEPVARPNKRVRSGSPGNGGGSYPMCQVDDCRADLSNAKDYHRRHKVCEIHSKTTKAVVGKQMQRFCQQCSRFHPLSEFDEGKRSCRRRLAGHNRRRRKSQPEDASSQLLVPGNREHNTTNRSMDVVNLLSMLARLQGNTAGTQTSAPSLPDRDRIIEILSKLNSLQNPSPKTPSFDLNVPQQCSFEQSMKATGNPSAPSTMDLLAVFSAAIAASAPDVLASLTRGSCYSSGNEKTEIPSVEAVTDANSRSKKAQILSSFGAGRSNCNNGQSQLEAIKQPVHETQPCLPLQLFGSAGDDSPPKLGSSAKYFSSESSNPMEDGSPSSSPPVAQKLFPLYSGTIEDNGTVEASTSRGWITPLELFKESERRIGNGVAPSLRYQAGYTSSSASDHSPSSSNSDTQDRTGRILFKLFDKDPSNFPGTLRTQIIDWLSHSPSEMESYIRPGCVVLSVYVSMPSIAWDELEEEFLQRVTSLVQCSDSEFWRNGRFLVRTSRQLVAHKDGKFRLCKSWRTWSSPELISASPVAVVSGQDTSLVLRGRNLTIPGTKIHCTYMGGYTSKEVLGSAHSGTIYDHSSLESFNLPGGSPNVFGRYFIEVENGFKGNSFPVIIADASICRELRALESEFDKVLGSGDVSPEDQVQDDWRLSSREDVLHFLNELGWLFQRKNNPCPCFTDFSSTRFKFLFTFAVERNWFCLTRTLLDILVERSSKSGTLLQESLEMLIEIQLLSRTVKRKCRKMVDLLLNYSVNGGTDNDASKRYLFPPNTAGPGGVTPLHLAASTQDSEEMVDALTDDPQEIGLNCWYSIRDDNGQSPHMYATARNNQSYNRLVARKLADRKNGQVSVMVGNKGIMGEEEKQTASRASQARSCAQCVLMDKSRGKRIARRSGLLQRPYVHSLLAIAAVCVCVCLCFRGSPQIGTVAPFKWENLEFGPR